jgi:hypothetical protein
MTGFEVLGWITFGLYVLLAPSIDREVRDL